jgi:DNA-binding ferritin-like protein (Dps family)
MTQIEKFMWNFAQDSQMIAVLEGILDLFEEGAASGRRVLDVTGDDVAGFALNVLAEAQSATWTGKKADQLNAAIHKSLRQQDPR